MKNKLDVVIKLLIALPVFISSVLFSAVAYSKTFDVEDPHICQTVVNNFTRFQHVQAEDNKERLIKAVLLHCKDDFSNSNTVVARILKAPESLTPSELTYLHILHSINLSNVEDSQACDSAKLAMAFATNGTSDVLRIRAELSHLSFCDVNDDNVAHTLKRLYQLSKEALSLNEPFIELAIHNQISYVYYNMGQNQLSADELERAIKISQATKADDYFVTLYNLSDAYLDAGEVNLAADRIAELEKLITEASSDFERWLYLYAQSYHALLIKNYQKIVNLSVDIRQIKSPESDALNHKLFTVQGLACFYLKDYACVETVILSNFPLASIAKETSLYALKLQMLWYAHKQNMSALNAAQQRYFDLVEQKLTSQQQAAKILGVAKLNNEVIQLNTEKMEKQLKHQNDLNRVNLIIIVMASVLILVLLIFLYRIRAKSRQKKLFS